MKLLLPSSTQLVNYQKKPTNIQKNILVNTHNIPVNLSPIQFSGQLEDLLPYTCIIHTETGDGSGFFINTKQGIRVLTCAHVVMDERKSFTPNNNKAVYFNDVEATIFPNGEQTKIKLLLDRKTVEKEGGIDFTVLRPAKKSSLNKIKVSTLENNIEEFKNLKNKKLLLIGNQTSNRPQKLLTNKSNSAKLVDHRQKDDYGVLKHTIPSYKGCSGAAIFNSENGKVLGMDEMGPSKRGGLNKASSSIIIGLQSGAI